MKNEQETEYRRAYRDGWIEAVNALEELLRAGVPAEVAHDRLFTHWGGALAKWEDTLNDIRQENYDDNVAFPPAMPIEP